MKIYRNSLNINANSWKQGQINNQGVVIDIDTTVYLETYIPITSSIISMSRSVYSSYMNVRFYNENMQYIGAGAENINIIVGSSASNPMSGGISFCCFEIINNNIKYMRINDESNNLSTLYMVVNGQHTAADMPAYEPYNVVDWYGYKYKLRASGAWSELDDKKAPWSESNAKVLRRKRTAKSKT